MSRIGKRPILIPGNVQISIEGRRVMAKGPKGQLSREIHPLVSVAMEGDALVVRRADDSRQSRAVHGLTRTLIDNMVVGVDRGFRKDLLVTGVGYKVEEQGKGLRFHLGFSSPVDFVLPAGVTAKIQRQKEIRVTLEAFDKDLLGLTAARMRALRPPEPYKGKGVQYADEHIVRKAGKAGAKQ